MIEVLPEIAEVTGLMSDSISWKIVKNQRYLLGRLCEK